MADGSLIFDTLINSDGFQKGLNGLKEDAKKAGIAVVASLGIAGGAVIKMADDASKGVNDIAAATGATGARLDELSTAMENVYASNFGENFEEIAGVVANAEQVIGGTSEEIEKLASNAFLLADSFTGFEDTEKTIGTVNTMMQKFGISADEAYNLLAQGSQNGANKNGDLLDIINEYASSFSDLGIDADTAMNILVNGAENGAFQIDMVGDAVKEFGIRTKDMSTGTNKAFTDLGFNSEEMGSKFANGGEEASQAFTDVINGLSAMDDPIKRNEAGVALFGTTWEDLGEDALLSLADVNGAVDSSIDSMEAINAVKYDNVGAALQGLGRELGVAFMPIVQEILPDLITAIQSVDVDAVVVALGRMWDTLVLLSPVVTGLVAAFVAWKVAFVAMSVISTVRNLTAGLTIAQLALNAAMLLNPIALFVGLIAGLIVAIVTLWNTNEGFRNFFIEAWETIKRIFTSVIDWITAKIGDFGTAAANIVTTIWDTITNTNWLQLGKDIISGILNGLLSMGSAVWDGVKSVGSSIVGGFTDFFGINSPSRLMRKKVGVHLLPGAVDGMDETIPATQKSINASMASLTNGIQGTVQAQNASFSAPQSSVESGTGQTSSASEASASGNTQPIVIQIEGEPIYRMIVDWTRREVRTI